MYCLIARDSNLLVFETFEDDSYRQQLRKECKSILSKKEREYKQVITKMLNIDTEDPLIDSVQWCERLKFITAKFHLLLAEGVFFGLVTREDYENKRAEEIC